MFYFLGRALPGLSKSCCKRDTSLALSFPDFSLCFHCRQKSFFFSAAYVMLIFGTQHFMKERRGYKLRAPLTLWSLGLALFR